MGVRRSTRTKTKTVPFEIDHQPAPPTSSRSSVKSKASKKRTKRQEQEAKTEDSDSASDESAEIRKEDEAQEDDEGESGSEDEQESSNNSESEASEASEAQTARKKRATKSLSATKARKSTKITNTNSEDDSSEDEVEVSGTKRKPKVQTKKRAPVVPKSRYNKYSRSNSHSSSLKNLEKKFADKDSLAVKLLSSCANLKKRRAAAGQSPYKDGIEATVLSFLDTQEKNIHWTEVDLFNFIFHCVGGNPQHISKDVNIQDDLSEEDWSDLLGEIVDQMGDTPQEKVLVSVGSKLSTGLSEYRKIYEEFWYILADKLVQNTARWGIDWITAITQRLVELSSIGVADIRYAVVTAVYQIGRALLFHGNWLQSKIATASRQMKACKTSQHQRKAHLKDQIETWNVLYDAVTGIVRNNVVTAVFIKRYRDARPNIRVASLSALGDYCLAVPGFYLQSMYLKYVGWMLFDREAEVRCAALTAFVRPFESSVVDTTGMERVLSKYLRRIAEICTNDVDEQVKEVAMELVLLMLQNDMFEVATEDSVWEELNLCPLQSSGTPKFRTFALSFVLEQLDSFDEGALSSERVASEQIAQLCQWVANSLSTEELDVSSLRYDLVDLVVDSIGSMPKHKRLLTNWSAILRALSSEESKKSDDNYLDSVKQRVIIRFFVACAKRSDEEDVDGLTLALLRSLPRLLVSFKSETSVLQSLAALPQYMSANVFGLSSRREEFGNLLSGLTDILLETTDRLVMLECGLSLASLSESDHPRKAEALTALKDVVGVLLSRLKEQLGSKYEDGDRTDESTEDVNGSIALCVLRLRAVSKQRSVCLLLGGRKKMDDELESLGASLFSFLQRELESRKVVIDEGDKIEIPDIWEDTTIVPHTHAMVSQALSAALQLMTGETAWRLLEELKALESENPPDYTDDLIEGHVVIRSQGRLTHLVSLCFDMFLEDFDGIEYSDAHIEFSITVQEAALQCIGDLRTLFPHLWSSSVSPFLRACALTNDDTISGAVDRFLGVLDHPTEHSEQVRQANDVVLTAARGAAANFQLAHRQEVSSILGFIAGHSKRSTELVLSLCRSIKRENPIRFLEVHMATLQTEFEVWAEREPEDVGDTPTDSQLTQNDEENKVWKEEFEVVVSKAVRLAPTLGIGKKRHALDKVFRQFFFEGLRFAFSREDPKGELVLGSRLAFLSLLSKYVRFIRASDTMVEVEKKLDDYEAAFRRDEEFEDDHTDVQPLVGFREACGFEKFSSEDTDTVMAGTTPASRRRKQSFSRPRMSTGSSISSIKSKISKMDSIEEGEEDSEEESEGPNSASSHKRRRRLSTLERVEESDGGRSTEEMPTSSKRPADSDDDESTVAHDTARKQSGYPKEVESSDDGSTQAPSTIAQRRSTQATSRKKSKSSSKVFVASDDESTLAPSTAGSRPPSKSTSAKQDSSDDESTAVPPPARMRKRASFSSRKSDSSVKRPSKRGTQDTLTPSTIASRGIAKSSEGNPESSDGDSSVAPSTISSQKRFRTGNSDDESSKMSLAKESRKRQKSSKQRNSTQDVWGADSDSY